MENRYHIGNDADTLADISCSDGDVPKWDAVVGQWDCGLDNDTLAGELCSGEQPVLMEKLELWKISILCWMLIL